MADTRTNAVGTAGASAFVMAGSLLGGDPDAHGRAASDVVLGVGFLGAGIIFKRRRQHQRPEYCGNNLVLGGGGVLAGLDSLHLSAILALIVLVTSIALRPLA
jgi:uncharacterized membrane protein YhiD involved in acid resistance